MIWKSNYLIQFNYSFIVPLFVFVKPKTILSNSPPWWKKKHKHILANLIAELVTACCWVVVMVTTNFLYLCSNFKTIYLEQNCQARVLVHLQSQSLNSKKDQSWRYNLRYTHPPTTPQLFNIRSGLEFPINSNAKSIIYYIFGATPPHHYAIVIFFLTHPPFFE